MSANINRTVVISWVYPQAIGSSRNIKLGMLRPQISSIGRGQQGARFVTELNNAEKPNTIEDKTTVPTDLCWKGVAARRNEFETLSIFPHSDSNT